MICLSKYIQVNKLYNNQNQLIKELISIGLSKYIDSRPIKFNSRHKNEAEVFANSLLAIRSNNFTFTKPILRNSFLKGCLDLTRDEQIEYLFLR